MKTLPMHNSALKIEYFCLIRSRLLETIKLQAILTGKTNGIAAENMFKVYENFTISTSYHDLIYTRIAQSTDLVQIVATEQFLCKIKKKISR